MELKGNISSTLSPRNNRMLLMGFVFRYYQYLLVLVQSDDDGTETTKSEPGNQSTEAETIKDSTGSENTHNISTPSEATEADKSSSSYTDIHPGAIDSNTTALQDAFARRKQDFVKKSLARVKRAKAKRFEVKPRVHIKKRVKPDKPVVAKKSKKSQELESKEKTTKRKLK
jgi:hypothetical protein